MTQASNVQLEFPILFTFTYTVVWWTVGAIDDLATSSLHSSRLSAFLMAAPSIMPVHSGMLSSHLFFCLPLLLPPCPCPAGLSCYVPVPFQFASRYCGQEVFVGPNGLPSSVSHLFVGDLISMACILRCVCC